MIGNFGNPEVFSFHATKFFNTFDGWRGGDSPPPYLFSFPMTLFAMLFLKEIRPRPRAIIIALSIFMVNKPVDPAGWYEDGLHVRQDRLWSGNSPGSLTISGFLDTLSEEARYFTEMLGGIDGVQLVSIGKDIRSIWMQYVFWLSIPAPLLCFMFARMEKKHRQKNIIFPETGSRLNG
jgi:hypothetical protein